jgi:hypothetical protein
MLAQVDDATTYEALRQNARRAEAIRMVYAEVEAVRQQAERTVNHSPGEELEKAPTTTGTGGQLVEPGVVGAAQLSRTTGAAPAGIDARH